MDENDAKHRRERSRKAAKAGTETHRRAEPALTWTGLTQAGYCDGISTQSGGDNSVTAPIHGDSQACGPRIRTGIMGRGASLTRRAGVRLTLIALARWRTKIASVAPIAVAYPRRSLSERAPLTLVLAMLRPVKPFARPPWDFFLPTQPNHRLLPNDGTLKHALPPSLTVLFNPRALLHYASSPQLLEQGHLNRAHFIVIVVSQASHQQSHAMTCNKNMAQSTYHATN
ncbi:uncharacterized protein FOBCDRAFT_294906 [Fusarium oxysporum Fo47]|uniref:uncharacterized protein n=1 Tax=Fusarium oxysporum Fo47 TaxID=660027 RepID=UPI00159B7C81|nr:uncharacterized protein FOBCDRAFT_294906 [Fusarium oxysporum Fo47]QKD56090.1 hypothetical protein FOBCDRAFT_294906 [Fusarium oxysporum Fo47]